MSLLDPEARTARGLALQREILAGPAPEPATLYDASWRDYVFAEIWSRPGLDRRARYLIALSGACATAMPDDLLDAHVRGALTLKALTLAELREAALHLSVYCGWARGALLDRAITRVANALGLEAAPFEPIRATPWDAQQRLAEGAQNFLEIMVGPGPKPTAPFYEGGILNFVFGEMWRRPALDERGRRWVTLVGVCEQAMTTPIRAHIYAALASGNATPEEMGEFVLHYAAYCGWPRGSFVQGVLLDICDKMKKGLPVF